ncbi:MAG: malonyl-CoA decarboxylase [Gammaproteobacteria bacterium]|nr:malonyl-CoA decarboxylase [Gammaproteobacteria bacterium]MDD9897251.1 malonyl-CoA decarboxylase [Gammaproteobacteria bacterium]MDD9957726.1 malonyl-CoA decarboxylase [Gammaproteobacteria bacterium]
MAFGRFQDFLSGLVKGQRERFFGGGEEASIDELVEKLMGTIGEVSAIVTARQVLDQYVKLDDEQKLEFFENLEQNFNANQAMVKLAFDSYDRDPSSANLNKLSKAAEPQRHELLRRLNSTPDATHDLVAMRTDLLMFLKENPELRSVDEDFVRLFSSWFGRGFLVLQTINWSTSAAILERIIRYEAVHEIKDLEDLRSRIDPPNRHCFAFFHPALVDEPLIFVQVALTNEIPGSINSILENEASKDPSNYNTATFYSISNCQTGLKSISFGNLLIKQVVQELQREFPSIKTFVTLSPIPGFQKWLDTSAEEELPELAELKELVNQSAGDAESIEEHADYIRKAVFNYLLQAKNGKYPADPVARFHLGNGASIHQLHASADLSEKGLKQSRGTMVNYLYDLSSIETNHERYATEGDIEFNDKLKSLLIKG